MVKPAPQSVAKFASRFTSLPDWDNWGSNSLQGNSSRRMEEEEEEELPVDYAFLDEDEPSDYNQIASERVRLRRSVSVGCLETGAHIVYRRRRPEQEAHHHDFSEWGGGVLWRCTMQITAIHR